MVSIAICTCCTIYNRHHIAVVFVWIGGLFSHHFLFYVFVREDFRFKILFILFTFFNFQCGISKQIGHDFDIFNFTIEVLSYVFSYVFLVHGTLGRSLSDHKRYRELQKSRRFHIGILLIVLYYLFKENQEGFTLESC